MFTVKHGVCLYRVRYLIVGMSQVFCSLVLFLGSCYLINRGH